MKISRNNLILVILVVLTTTLLSWNRFNHSSISAVNRAFDNHYQLSGSEYAEWQAENDNDAFLAEDDGYRFSTDTKYKTPPSAEDVLVQKIPGDNNHVLMMAYYSKERYSGESVTLDQFGSKVDFRDDGRGYDKKAGDGLYTAKIVADVNEFRKLAQGMDEGFQKSGNKKIIRFEHRAMTYNSDELESFNFSKLDNNQPVSIASLSPLDISPIEDSVRKKCIYITDLKVVEDPTRTWNPCTQTGNVDGPWTFKTLVKQLASKSPDSIATDAQVSNFMKTLLGNFNKLKVINSDSVYPRKLVNSKILDPWLAKSLAGGSPPGQLDMKYAPFKLTSLVNRFDLRERFSGIPAGEGRYTFNLINSTCTDKEDFTVVIEYAVNLPDNCDSLRLWAQQWYNLKNYGVGSTTYNQLLNAITDKYSLCGSNPANTNQSSLQTFRTNDRTLSPLPIVCEFREFILNTTNHLPFERAITHIAADRYNVKVDNAAVRRMASYVNTNSANINIDNYIVPDFWLDSPFRAGKVQILGPTTGSNLPNVYYWDATTTKGGPAYIQNYSTRQVWSLNACSGCHAGETQTNFTHVDPVFFGTEATLSGFLTGKPGQGGSYDWDLNPNNDSIMVKDPALRPQPNVRIRGFNDILRRAIDLKNYATTPCGTVLAMRDELMFQHLHMVH